MIKLDFLPDPQRAAAIDAAVHDDLHGSLRHIADRCGEAAPEITQALAHPIQMLEGGQRLNPEAFGLYFALGESLFRDDLAKARTMADRLAGLQPAPTGLNVMARGSAAARSLDAIWDDRLGDSAASFAPLPPEQLAPFQALLDDGLALLAEAAPDLRGELDAILRQVLCATDPQGAKMSFDGSSHYQFWGLLLLNPKHHKTPIAVAEVLAHEAAHSLLFGLTRTEPLTLNDDDELFTSPLRVDPRPMDGIYHATFVSARMAWAMETIAQSGVLNAEDLKTAQIAAQQDRENFAAGYGTVATHGKLSDTGAAIIENARAWVEGG